jgi:hypothetical protein
MRKNMAGGSTAKMDVMQRHRLSLFQNVGKRTNMVLTSFALSLTHKKNAAYILDSHLDAVLMDFDLTSGQLT